ncbi:unnamed protein product [Macrosiphum euphorbiae]|uniref:Uncharacterized protein n=1 Tax=Macrosiphum euphorbiae TaxID=13131 RepID=A0AAV0WDR2_9HEMI|nr:unnamed protein product [Macrosiphum euphorbiae]
MTDESLKQLLKKWELEILYQTCIDQLVNIKVLKIMKFEHANELLKSYPVGTKVIFTHELEKWQKKIKSCRWIWIVQSIIRNCVA